MEMRYPIVLILGILSIIIYIIFSKKEKSKYIVGGKIANTKYIKETEYYKNKLKEYKKILFIIKVLYLIVFVMVVVLISRPTSVKSNNVNEYNRDIFLCMDVSSSVDELNLQLVEKLKTTIKSLKGERFGISIFNASSVTLVPLTDDYEYVISVLNKIEESIKSNNVIDYNYIPDDYFYTTNYIISGTLEGAEERGSSLIGDGLATCVYNFSNLSEKRTRIIIFSTDNDLQGNPIVTLKEAAQISKNKNVFVYGIGASLMNNNDRVELKEAVEITEGRFYDERKMSVDDIVNDIESTSKSLIKKQNNITKIDVPQIPFVVIIISIIVLIFYKKKVML